MAFPGHTHFLVDVYAYQGARFIKMGLSPSVFAQSFNSSRAKGDFCRLLIIFTDTLDPDQKVGPDLD